MGPLDETVVFVSTHPLTDGSGSIAPSQPTCNRVPPLIDEAVCSVLLGPVKVPTPHQQYKGLQTQHGAVGNLLTQSFLCVLVVLVPNSYGVAFAPPLQLRYGTRRNHQGANKLHTF